MKIALAWLNQIRSEVNVGGFTAETLDSLVAQVAASYHKEHTVDDGHSTIHASGTISERARTVPMGEWIKVPFLATNFTADLGAAWTVTSAEQLVLQYMFVGTTMFVSFNISVSTIATATPSTLQIVIPTTTRFVALQQFASYGFNDNGTTGTGMAFCGGTAQGVQINLRKDFAAATNFSISGALSVAGQLAFDTSGTS